MNRLLASGLRFAHELFWNDHDAAAHAGEATVLGEAAELNGAIARAFDFIDRVRELRIANEGFVGGVVEDGGAVGQGVFHPGFELCTRGYGARRIVRVAEVGQIDRLIGDLGHEAVGWRAFEVVEARVSTAFISLARVARHDVGVHIHGIHRVGDGDLVPGTEDVEDVAGIAFAAVGDENLIGFHVDAAGLEVVFGDGVAQEIVALLRAIATEGGAVAHFIDGLVHGRAHGLWQRFGHVADAAADQAFGRLGVGLGENPHATGDFGEEVTGFELVVVFVDVGHGRGKGRAVWRVVAGMQEGRSSGGTVTWP